MRKLAALSTALLLAACGQQDVADQFRSAMPSTQEVQVGAPAAGQAATARVEGAPTARLAATATAAVAGGRSGYALTSYLFATSVNTSVAFTLARLHAVTLWPPTACTDDACTWGPGSEQGEVNEFQLVVSRAGEGFDYALQGRPKGQVGAPWISVIAGQAFPGQARHRGNGTLTIDFDQAWAGLAHGVYQDGSPRVQEDFGVVQISYDARNDLEVQAAFIGSKDAERFAADPTARVDVWYGFGGSAAGGDLHLAFRTLPLGDASESVSLHTRWANGGNGRGDVEYVGFQAPGGPYHASECWADAADGFALTYDTEPVFGAETACTGFPGADYLAFPAAFP
jgi:hypothetical protein